MRDSFFRSGIFAVALALLSTAPAVAQPAPDFRNSQVEIVYVRPSSAALQALSERLKNRKVLDELQQFLTPLRLPRKLTVKLDQCGSAHVAYKSGGPVTICYELVDQIEKIAAKVPAADRAPIAAGAFIDLALHELAIAVFDIFEVPVWGRGGDAADRLAALLMLKFGDEFALQAIRGTTGFFLASEQTWTGSAFANADSPEAQRYFNYLCIAYGGAPITFKYLVSSDPPLLPPERARRCAGEYRQVLSAFDKRIMPYVDPDLMVKVRAMPWLSPQDVK